MNKKNFSLVQPLFLSMLLLTLSCQMPPTKSVEFDSQREKRSFSKIDFDGSIDYKRAVVVDIRSRFDFEMSKLPRSFHLYWKDWDLTSYSDQALQEKGLDLQRQLALKGIDPLTHVLILGYGLRGQGEEFFVAEILFRLGIKRITFLNQARVLKALSSKESFPLTNVPHWQKEVTSERYPCVDGLKNKNDKTLPDYIISNQEIDKTTIVLKPSQVFDENLKIKNRSWIKKLSLSVSSPESFWAYGLASYFAEQNRNVCLTK